MSALQVFVVGGGVLCWRPASLVYCAYPTLTAAGAKQPGADLCRV